LRFRRFDNMRSLIGGAQSNRARRGSNTLCRDKQDFGFDTLEENFCSVRQPLTGYRPRTEDFVFPERFDGGGGDGSKSNGVTNGIEDLD
jgi:hypothetical protein